MPPKLRRISIVGTRKTGGKYQKIAECVEALMKCDLKAKTIKNWTCEGKQAVGNNRVSVIRRK